MQTAADQFESYIETGTAFVRNGVKCSDGIKFKFFPIDNHKQTALHRARFFCILNIDLRKN